MSNVIDITEQLEAKKKADFRACLEEAITHVVTALIDNLQPRQPKKPNLKLVEKDDDE